MKGPSTIKGTGEALRDAKSTTDLRLCGLLARRHIIAALRTRDVPEDRFDTADIQIKDDFTKADTKSFEQWISSLRETRSESSKPKLLEKERRTGVTPTKQ
jgi:hypothetical protein